MSILGLGSSVLSISGNGSSRIFYITAPARIYGLKISGGGGNGIGGGPGGAIATGPNGSVTLDGVFVKQNPVTGADGGGVFFSGGTNVIRNSTFSQNTATGNGGAVLVQNGSLAIINSTITANTASDGGAVSVTGGSLVIRSTTIKNNTGQGSILVSGTASLDFGNSIIDTIRRDSAGSTAASSGHNLISVSRNDVGQPVTYVASDIFNANAPIDVLNEGSSGAIPPTMGLPVGHPAIDAGNNSLAQGLPIIYDQRSRRRIYDGNADGQETIDIGSVEQQPSQGPLGNGTLVSGRILSPGGRPARSVVHVNFPDSTNPPIAVLTNPFGYYRFRSYGFHYAAMTVVSKQGTSQPRIVHMIAHQENIDFIVD